jgi:hypothetical protein
MTADTGVCEDEDGADNVGSTKRPSAAETCVHVSSLC